MYRVFGGPLVPNLAKLPRERWREALVPQERSVRDLAALNLALGRDGMRAARDLVDALPPSPSELAREAIAAGPPHPSARRVEPQSRQLNVRVTARAYEDLCAAARLLGGTPTQIARMLVNGGVRRVLAEHDRAIDAARRAGER